MPSRYGFETEEDRQADTVILRNIAAQIDPTVHAICTDYLDAMLPQRNATLRRAVDETAWLVSNVLTRGQNEPLRVDLCFPEIGVKEPTLFVTVAEDAAASPRNAERLANVLQAETGYPVHIRRLEVHDD
jgi:hypothetical protein